MRTVEHAEPFLEELAQPADEAGERVGRKQYGGKLGNADLLPSLPNSDGGGAGVVAERLQQESVSAVQAWRAGTANPRGGRFRSVALEHVLAPLLGVEQRHADNRALPGQAWRARQGVQRWEFGEGGTSGSFVASCISRYCQLWKRESLMALLQMTTLRLRATSPGKQPRKGSNRPFCASSAWRTVACGFHHEEGGGGQVEGEGWRFDRASHRVIVQAQH